MEGSRQESKWWRVLTRICLRCGREVEQGKQCQCMNTTRREYENEGRRKDVRAFYDSQMWRKLRESIKARANGCDEYVFATTDRIVPGYLVHHIYPADEYPAMRLLPNNLIYVSKDTHEWIHSVYRQGLDAKHELIKKLFRIVAKTDDDAVDWYYKLLDDSMPQRARRQKR